MGPVEEVAMTQTQTMTPAGTTAVIPSSIAQVAAVSGIAGLVLGCLFAAIAIAFGAPAAGIAVGVTACSLIASLAAVLSEVTVRSAVRG